MACLALNGGHDDETTTDRGDVRATNTRVAAAAGERVLARMERADDRRSGAVPAPVGAGVVVGEADAGGVIPSPETPVPPPEPATIPSQPVANLLSPEIVAIVCAPEFTWDCATVQRIVFCESRGHPDSVGAGSWGLWQIQASVHAEKWPDFWAGGWSDPVRNTEYAYAIWLDHGGFSPWSCY